ncbi:TPA: restriction endonuclease subunit S [Photobacterium damselae]
MSTLEQVVPDGFRQSEIGIFPTDWKINSLAEISTKITDGTHDTPKPIKEGIPFLTAIHVKENNIAFESCYFLPKSVHDEIYKRCNPEYEDILMVNIGAGTGTTALVNVKYPFSLKNVALIKPDKKFSDGRFLNQVLSFLKDEILESLSAGGAQPFLSLSQIGQINIPSPSKEEQTAIANALSDVDALLTELENLIAKKQAIKTATMQQLLTGKTRLTQFATYTEGEKLGQPKGTKSSELGEIPEDWDVKAMGDLGTTFGGLSGKNKNDFGHGRGRYVPFTNVMANTVIDEEHLEKVDVNEPQNEVRKNDLLFNGSSETPDEVCFCSMVASEIDNLFLNSFCFGFRAKSQGNYIPLYLAYWFRSNNGRSAVSIMAQGSTRYNISKSQFLRLSTVLPPIEEQTAIASIFSDMDREIQTLEQRLAKTRQIKQGMMQELLTGRTRLPFETEY